MRFASLVVLFCFVLTGRASAGATPEESIRKVLDEQAAAWNRGDLREFAASYREHCTLVGATINETSRDEVLAHYQQKYPSRGAMGKLAFSGITVHPVDARVATATGHWRLDRDAASGGPVGGLFSLVFEFLHNSWQIVLDHTS